MQTITMQGIADLARVQRPVVTFWRSRYASSDHPFPAPVQSEASGAQLFDTEEVNRWLANTGLGNNPEAAVESPLFSDLIEKVQVDLDRVSQLLMLQHWHGSSLTELTPYDVVALVESREAAGLIDVPETLDALGDTALVGRVEQLTEAGFGGARALARVSAGLVSREGAWSGEALTAEAEGFLGQIIVEVCLAESSTVAPQGRGGLILACAMVDQLSESDQVMLSLGDAAQAGNEERLMRRRLAVRHASAIPSSSSEGPAPRLYLAMRQSASSAHEFCERVEDLLVTLTASDQLIVVGPASWMLDKTGAPARRRLFAPSPNYRAPLRYTASLPKGFSRFGGRRRLALWAFGRPEAGVTVVADHSTAEYDEAASIASDIAAALSGSTAVKSHAFVRSSVRESAAALTGDRLVAEVVQSTTVPGGERLAKIWELNDGLLADVEFTTSPGSANRVTFDGARRTLGRDLSGFKIATQVIGAHGPGKVAVVGLEELRDPDRIGTRGVDRLELERVAPRAVFTEPGDVIYATRQGNSAWVDERGGHLVLAPARVFRCLRPPAGEAQRTNTRTLTPAVVAADICAMTTADRRAWRFRATVSDDAETIEEFSTRLGARRRELREQLQRLEALEHELVNGLADGVLAIADTG